MTVQNSSEFCIAAPGVDTSNGEDHGVFSYVVLHNGYKLPGAVIYVASPAESKIEYIPNIILLVL